MNDDVIIEASRDGVGEYMYVTVKNMRTKQLVRMQGRESYCEVVEEAMEHLNEMVKSRG